MSELSKITGFYTAYFSKDLPGNHGDGDKFGFDEGVSEPVFGYSLDETEQSFVSGKRMISTLQRNLSEPQTGVLIVETHDNEALMQQNTSSSEWQNVFKLLDFVFNNQKAIEVESPENSDLYNSWTDEQLGNSDIANNPNYVSNYVKGSFSDSRWKDRGRIEYFNCQVLIDNRQIQMTIYLVPDVLVASGPLLNQFEVYTYIDLDGNKEITKDEMNTQMILKTHEIMKGNRFNSTPLIFETEYHELVKNSSPKEYLPAVMRAFWIYHNYSDARLLTSDVRKNVIRNYILTEIGLGIGNDKAEASRQYPDLFSDQSVKIIPIYKNIKEIDGTAITVHPLSNVMLDAVKEQWMNTSQLQGNPKWEIFYIGGQEGKIQEELHHIFPLIAIENSGTDITYPISDRFIDYDVTPFNGVTVTSSESGNFRFVMNKVLTYLRGFSEQDSVSSISVISDVEFIPSSSTSLQQVSFTYLGVKYEVIGSWQ